MLYLNFETAVRLIEEAIELKGADYVYEPVSIEPGVSTCMYMQDGEPGCIVGHALHSQGIDLSLHEGILAGATLRALQSGGLLTVTNKAASFLEWVQIYQDDSMPWGQALQEALEVVDDMTEASK